MHEITIGNGRYNDNNIWSYGQGIYQSRVGYGRYHLMYYNIVIIERRARNLHLDLLLYTMAVTCTMPYTRVATDKEFADLGRTLLLWNSWKWSLCRLAYSQVIGYHSAIFKYRLC